MAAVALSCGCETDAVHERGDRLVRCVHGHRHIVRARTSTTYVAFVVDGGDGGAA